MFKLNIDQQETKRDIVARHKARDQNGQEKWLDEVVPSTRTLDAGGNWTEWVTGPTQFWHGQTICARKSETVFEPVMTDDVLTLEKE